MVKSRPTSWGVEDHPISRMRNEQSYVYIVPSSELEQYISEVYDTDYELMPSEEVGSSQYAACMKTHIQAKELEEYEKQELEEFKEGGHQFKLNVVLQDMCNHGLLEEGIYIIEVNW